MAEIKLLESIGLTGQKRKFEPNTFMTALFTALIIVPFLRKSSLDQGNLDFPGERKQHSEPMPTLGGIAIFWSLPASA